MVAAKGGRGVLAPRRPDLNDPDVQRLIADIAPGSPVVDLGGTMSLNILLESRMLVLRVHPSFVSRPRLIALQQVRRHLADRGLVVPTAVRWRRSTVLPCADRLAEIEPYIQSARPEPTMDAYRWMFASMGALHRELATLTLAVPRPVVATYGTPASLLRFLPVAEAAVRHDPKASDVVRLLREQVRRLRARWVPSADLPTHLVHGDIRLSNVHLTPNGEAVYFDFGFLARRPRVHDLAYALAWIVLRPDSRGTAESFDWGTVPELLTAYEDTAGVRLSALERRALAPYLAAVPLYLMSIAGYMADPVGHIRNETRRAFLGIGAWLLAHPDVALG
jgi:Ser/Thr protein kinase RdoA (MazF antagonist)